MITAHQKSAAVAEGLRKGKMESKEFSRGPLGKDIMALRIGVLDRKDLKKEGIRLWTGTAEMDITNVNARQHQAVVAVDESARSITRTYEIEHRYNSWNAGSS